MRPKIRLINLFFKDESGQDLIEYALVAGIVGLGVVTSVSSLASTIATGLGEVASAMSSAFSAL